MTSHSSRILELASIISENTAQIDQHLTTNGLSKPSLEIDSPVSLDLPEALRASHHAILEANTELTELLSGPQEIVTDYQVRSISIRDS